jgi:3,5-epimerase/4-reductase
MASSSGSSGGRFLVFGGATGWIGQKVVALLKARGDTASAAASRLEDRDACAAEIDLFRPTHVVNCAGLTGRPNVDWW